MAEEKKKAEEEEIDLLELVKLIWTGRKFIVKVTCAFITIGLIIAFTSPVEYQASCKLLPENQEGGVSNLGGLSGLAGLAGIDLGGMSGSSGSLSPQLYPEIVYSLPFLLELVNDTLYFEQKGFHATSYAYFTEHNTPSILGYIFQYTIGLPGIIKSLFVKEKLVIEDSIYKSDVGFLRFDKKQWNLIAGFADRVSINLDEGTGVISISGEMPDPLAAAQLTKKIELLITEKVIKYKTDKASKNLKFIEKAYIDAKKEFQFRQVELARAQDRNLNVNSLTGQIEVSRLENEYNVAFEVYKGLASQVEQAKIKLKEETPVFTILEPVRVPEQKNKPKRTVLLVVFTTLGVLVGGTFVLIKVLFRKYWMIFND